MGLFYENLLRVFQYPQKNSYRKKNLGKHWQCFTALIKETPYSLDSIATITALVKVYEQSLNSDNF